MWHPNERNPWPGILEDIGTATVLSDHMLNERGKMFSKPFQDIQKHLPLTSTTYTFVSTLTDPIDIT